MFTVLFLFSSGYIYFMSSLEQAPLLQLVITGGAYPLGAHLFKEVVYDFFVQDADADLGVTALDIEKGIFIVSVATIERESACMKLFLSSFVLSPNYPNTGMRAVCIDVGNKVAVFSIASTGGFLAAVGASALIESALVCAAVIWHRSKGVAVNTLKENVLSFQARISDEASASANESNVANRRFLEKAAYRHATENEKKGYEFRRCEFRAGQRSVRFNQTPNLLETHRSQTYQTTKSWERSSPCCRPPPTSCFLGSSLQEMRQEG